MTTFDLDLRATPPASATLPRSSSAVADWLRLVVATLARVVLFSVLGMALWGALPLAIGWHPTTVMTGSMEPRIQPGDVVVAKPVAESDLHRGQVLLFDDPDQVDHLRLHRYDSDGAAGTLVTRGDANPEADSTPVERSAVEGVGYLRIPFVGLPVLWLQEARVAQLVVTAAGLLLVTALSRLDSPLRARQEALAGLERELAPAAPRGERRAARRHERRLRRLRTAGASLSLLALAGGLAVTLVVAGGSSAGYAAQTVNPRSTLSTGTFDCLTESYNGQTSFGFPYNETSGTTTADGSSFARTGTLVGGASFVPGSCAKDDSPALQLDGTGQVLTAVQLGGQPAFTIETWFRTTTTTGGSLAAFTTAQSGNATTADRALYMTNAGTLALGVRPTTSTVRAVTTPRAYNDGQWHHVAVTMSSSGTSFYVDGAFLGSSTMITSAQSATGYWRVGSAPLAGFPSAPTSSGFTGTVDGTVIYNNSAQGASALQARYAAGH